MIPTYFCDYIHFEEDLALDLNKFEFPSHKDDIQCIPNLIEIGSLVLERRLKNIL
jgi:hypothetical protein